MLAQYGPLQQTKYYEDLYSTNKCIRIINSAPYNSHTNQLFLTIKCV